MSKWSYRWWAFKQTVIGWLRGGRKVYVVELVYNGALYRQYALARDADEAVDMGKAMIFAHDDCLRLKQVRMLGQEKPRELKRV